MALARQATLAKAACPAGRARGRASARRRGAPRALAEHADAALALHTHAAAVIDAEPLAHGGAHGGALGDLAGLLNPAADKPKPLSACEQNPSCDPANYARIEAIAERLIPR